MLVWKTTILSLKIHFKSDVLSDVKGGDHFVFSAVCSWNLKSSHSTEIISLCQILTSLKWYVMYVLVFQLIHSFKHLLGKNSVPDMKYKDK